jgi:hypothetical protein
MKARSDCAARGDNTISPSFRDDRISPGKIFHARPDYITVTALSIPFRAQREFLTPTSVIQ